MKKSEELRIERKAKADAMLAITDKATAEKRELTDDEQIQWEHLDKECRSITANINRIERESILRSYSGKKKKTKIKNNDVEDDDDDVEDDDPDASRHQHGGGGPYINRNQPATYDVSKAMREFARGYSEDTMTGFEAETQQELSRGIESNGILLPPSVFMRDQNTTNGASSIDVTIDPQLSIIGKAPLYKEMGLTILPNLTGAFKLGKKTPDVAESGTTEKSAITQTANQPTFVDMSPERYGETDIFTKELLAQRNPAVQAAIIADMLVSVDRKITANAYTVALAAATEVAAGAITVAGFNALMAAVDADGAFAMARSSFFTAKGVKVDTGSGKFLTTLTPGKNGVGVTHDGVNAFYSTLFADGDDQQYVIYGAWKEIYLGLWGAVELLLNPYTYQKNGQIEMTVNRLAKLANRNAAAFVKSPDLDAN